MRLEDLRACLDKRSIFARKERIHNTSLVVDCGSLQQFLLDRLYSDKRSPEHRADLYGGNLVAYGELVRDYFGVLTKCNLSPIFVLAGVDTMYDGLGEIKHGHELERSEDTLKVFLQLRESDTDTDGPLLPGPRLFEAVFRHIVGEFDGFQVVQAPHEANTLITRLANELKCPVLADDCDFLLRPLQRGFILAEDLAGRVGPVKQLDCFVWRREYLSLSFNGCGATKLPLLRVLLDETIASVFKPVVQRIAGEQTDCIGRLLAIILWLAERSLADARKYILDHTDRDKRKLAGKFIATVLDTYSQDHCPDDLETFLGSVYPPRPSQPGHGQKLNTRDQPTPAQHLAKIFTENHVPSSTLSILLGRTIYEPGCISYVSLGVPAPSKLRLRIYAIIAALLRPKSQDESKMGQSALSVYGWHAPCSRALCVSEFEVIPLKWLDNYGLLKHTDCYEFVRMPREERQRLLMAAFRIDNTGLLSVPSHPEYHLAVGRVIFLHLLDYIALETGSKFCIPFFDAVQTAIYYYHTKEHHPRSLSNFYMKLADQTRTKNQYKYPTVPHGAYLLIVHMINSLQLGYEALASMNGLFGGILPQPRPDRWLNGPFIYRLTVLSTYYAKMLPTDSDEDRFPPRLRDEDIPPALRSHLFEVVGTSGTKKTS